MAVYKTMTEAPTGVKEPEGGEVDEIEVEVEQEPDDAAEFLMGPEDEAVDPMVMNHYANLAEHLDDDILSDITKDLMAGYETDLASRGEWEELLKTGIALLGLDPTESTSEPFDGACMATHPLLLEAVVKYQAKARQILLPPEGPARTKIVGPDTPEMQKAAGQWRERMNMLMYEGIPEYKTEHDRMLFHQGFEGSGVIKVFWDSNKDRPCQRFVKAQNFVVNYDTSDLKDAERICEVMPTPLNEIRKYQRDGLYRDVDLERAGGHEEDAISTEEQQVAGFSRGETKESDDLHTLLEFHVNYDIPVPGLEDPDGIGVPYVITVHKDTQEIMAIYRNWRPDDPKRLRKNYYIHYCLIPGFGWYGYGYLHLLGGLSKTATINLRQLTDAGTFSNLPAGFKAHGLRMSDPDEPFRPGEWRDINAPAMDVQRSLLPLPYKEPSQTLFHLLGFVVDAGQKFADSTEGVVADANNYGPVGTTLALMEAGGKLSSAIYDRLYDSQKEEISLLLDILLENVPELGDPRKDMRIYPVTNPRVPTETHRLARAQATMGILSQAPDQHNQREVLRQVYAAMGYEEPERLLAPLPPEGRPMNPIDENAGALRAAPLAVAGWQDHNAHIQTHISFMNNPVYAHNKQAVMLLADHVMEHLMWKFRQEMEQEMGIPLPPSGENLPPQIENELSRRAAAASQVLLQRDMEKGGLQIPGAEGADQVAMMDLALRQRNQKLDEAKFEFDKAMDMIKESNKLAIEESRSKTKLTSDAMKNDAELKRRLMEDFGTQRENARDREVEEKRIDATTERGRRGRQTPSSETES